MAVSIKPRTTKQDVGGQNCWLKVRWRKVGRSLGKEWRKIRRKMLDFWPENWRKVGGRFTKGLAEDWAEGENQQF